ncbi:hypothetical protein B566_EDAN008782 [Ephemera danica]|nr:hypothetical protein B566_EDAN008782 [Ephemera danica]
MVLLFILTQEYVKCRLQTPPPRFLLEPANPYNLRIEPPILVSAKLLLDSKSSPESSEITTNDDSPPTIEENYSISQDWWQFYGPVEPVDSNAAEENFDDDSDGPVRTLPERHKRDEPETEVSEKVEEQKTETTLANESEIETTTTRHRLVKNMREKKNSTKRGEKMKSIPKYPSHSRTARPMPKAENILYLFENASISKTNQ